MSARARRAADNLTHAAGCPGGAALRYRDDDGAKVVRCTLCGAAGAVDALAPPIHTRRNPGPETPATPPPAAPPPLHACRPHYRPVNWRGRGCPLCDQERHHHHLARAQRRAERKKEQQP